MRLKNCHLNLAQKTHLGQAVNSQFLLEWRTHCTFKCIELRIPRLSNKVLAPPL